MMIYKGVVDVVGVRKTLIISEDCVGIPGRGYRRYRESVWTKTSSLLLLPLS